MANLDAIATQTVTNLATLLEHSHGVQSTLDESHEQLDAIAAHVETTWTELTQRAQAVLDRVASAQAELAAEADQSVAAITQLQNKLESTTRELAEDIAETQTAIAHSVNQMDTHLPELTTRFQSAETALNSLREHASNLTAEMETAFSATEDHLADEFNEVVIMEQSDVEALIAGLQQKIEEYRPLVEAKVNEFVEQAEDLYGQLQRVIEDGGVLMSQTTLSTLEQLAQFQRDGIDGLMTEINDLSRQTEQMGGLMDSTIDSVLSVKDDLMMAMDTTNVGINTATSLLSDVVNILDV